ncbi:MAG: protein rep [Acidithiobacillus caldus]|nr:protein rep [Acidithiobacillus caldus]
MNTAAASIAVANTGCKQFEFLTDSSPKDRPWDDHRRWADKMAAALDAAGMNKEAARVRDCANALFFRLAVADDTGEITFKLRSAPFCHWRHCPVCQWRRSLKSKGIVMSALPAILAQYPNARFAMLTLTVRNCSVSDLRQTILAMNKGWKRLLLRDEWPALGWIRAVEVTRGEDGSAHPHFHALLMLPPGYFGRKYLSTRAWVRLWRESMRLDYDPVCDVRMVRAKVPTAPDSAAPVTALRSSVAEVVKYATKAADLLAGGPDWLAEYAAQVRGLKFLTSGGVLKGVLKACESKDEDLVHIRDESEAGDEDAREKLRFDWRRKHGRYARKKKAAVSTD